MPDEQIKYLAALTHFLKFGPIKLKRLANHFPDWQTAFQAKPAELTAAGIEEPVALEFTAARYNLDPDSILEKLGKEKIKIIRLEDDGYPPLLREIHNPPLLLYYQGELAEKDDFNFAIVGTRKSTPYGEQVAAQITAELSGLGLTIVSGLALGIDSIAHNAAIKALGRTIAVLGSGLDRQNLYPAANRYLAERIASSGGTVISEFPPGTPPLKHHFPQRNRLISGISRAVLVVEADEKSGALITARCALEQNREVFAVPGNIYSPVSSGPNKLIKQGAGLVASAQDIIEAMNLEQVPIFQENKKIMPETAEEKAIAGRLSHEPAHINDLVRLTGLGTSVINSTLVIMEMKGIVKNVGGMKYIII